MPIGKDLKALNLWVFYRRNRLKDARHLVLVYDRAWLNRKGRFVLDPNTQFFSGAQYPMNKENFGIFLVSMSDTWERTLLKRRATQRAQEKMEIFFS